MAPRLHRRAAALLVALLSPTAWAADATTPAASPRLVPENGTILAVDLAAHALTVQAEGGAFTVALDRNTLVYLPGGLATVADLRPGARVRVGRDGDRASWVEVREAAVAEPRPAQGTGPGGGAPPAADTTGPPIGRPPPVGPGSPQDAAGTR